MGLFEKKVKPVSLPMERVTCKEHGTDIVVFKQTEETLFVDNNKAEVVIFTDGNGNHYLKRFMVSGCNENCETIKKLLQEKDNAQ